TGINQLRIYNPVKQGHDQDPTGLFTRTWVPELADIPDAYLQEPWKSDTPPDGYPPPIVDVQQAAREARDRVYAFRRAQPGFREEAQRVAAKHGSRKGPRRRSAAEAQS
ncbi:MAG: FAD-binding domain-containing protein, partial [Pseudomonadota bacterium]